MSPHEPRNKTKRPRGAKLDAQRRAEYEADVAGAAAWDTSGWTRWIVTGRVLPERCDVTIGARDLKGRGAGGRVKLRLEVIRSHIVVICALEKCDPSVFQIADMVRSALAFPVDYVAFRDRGACEVVLDLCINGQSGEAIAVPVFEPMFNVADAGLCFTAQDDGWNGEIPWSTTAVPELPTALHDVTAAIRYPRRTFEYCWMAVETMRRHFDPPSVAHWKPRHAKGRTAMCTELRVTVASLNALEAIAARSRHGELVISIDWQMRKRALELAWELVARFIHHLQGLPRSQWKLLDVRLED
jgi:hypothetical protein